MAVTLPTRLGEKIPEKTGQGGKRTKPLEEILKSWWEESIYPEAIRRGNPI